MIAAVRVLLDTHVLLRLLSAPQRVKSSTRELLRDPQTEVLISAASAWEIAIKTRAGRLAGQVLLSAWNDVVADLRATELAIGADDAILAGGLSWDHQDPFDRVLVSQAIRRNLAIVTVDRQIVRSALAPTIEA